MENNRARADLRDQSTPRTDATSRATPARAVTRVGEHHTATLLIDHDNRSFLAVAARAGFRSAGDVDGQLLFARPVVPPEKVTRDRGEPG